MDRKKAGGRTGKGAKSVGVLGVILGFGGCQCDETGGITALQGTLVVRDGADPSVNIERIDLGEVPLGVSVTLPLSASNVGSDTLFVCVEGAECGEPSRFEPASAPFSLRFDRPDERGFGVAPGDDRSFTVRFMPDTEGAVEATMVLRHDGSNGPETRIAVVARGVAPDIRVRPSPLEFGPVTVGRQRTLELTLENPTGFLQPVRVPALPEQDRVIFGIVSPTEGQLQPGATLEAAVPARGQLVLEVFFLPDEERSYADALEVSFCPTCQVTVPLSGEGIRPIFEVSPGVLDFGDVPEEMSATRSFVVRNLSDRYPIAVESVEVAGSDPQFAATAAAPVPAVLGPSETLEVEVRYAGASPGEHEGEIRVFTSAWDDPETGVDESVGQVALRGRTMGPRIDAFPGRVSFGTVAIGATAARRMVSVQNIGTSPLTVSEIRFESMTPEIAYENPPATLPVVLAPGEARNLEVRYLPDNPGLDRARFVLVSDDRNRPEVEVEVVGVGGVPTTCSIAVAPGQVTFGLVERGRVARLPVEIRNMGAQPCALSGVALTGAMELTLADEPPATVVVPPGQRTRLTVAYAPADYGLHEASLAFDVDDPGQPRWEVPVRGASQPSEVLIIPSQVDFNVVPVRCRSPIRPVTVYNTGARAVTINRIYLDPTTSAEFEVNGPVTPYNLRAGASVAIELRYRPNDLGSDVGVLFVEHSAAPGPVAVPLSGEGQISPTVTDVFNQNPNPQADILFVIDDSGSMGNNQRLLGANLGTFLDFAIAAQVDFHIGVTTTDVRSNARSGRLVGNPRIVDRNTPNLQTAFRNNTNVGTRGSASERGFEAAYLALSDPLVNTHNGGFLRPDASLAIIFVSDEPEQSPQSLQFYENFFRNIKGFNNPSMFSASSIVGTVRPQCSGPGGSAIYAPRYIQVAQNTGGVVESICSANWGQTLANIGQNSFGLRRQFTLSSQPVPSTVSVRVNGTRVAPSSGGQDGWTYDGQANTISFSTAQVPAQGSTISVTYTVACL